MLKISANIFISKGVELFVLSTGKTVGEYSDKLKKEGFQIFHIPFRKTVIFFIEVYRLIKEERIDIVHIHTERAFFWYSIIAKIRGVKIIRTIHSIFAFKGYLKFKRKLQRTISYKLLGVKFVSISNSVKENEKEYYNNNSLLIKNWVDDLYFIPSRNANEKLIARKNWGLLEEQIVIISLGSCSKVKNHADILKALALLIKWETNIIYLHVGEGESLSEETNLANKLGISKFVKFVGKTDNIHEILISSDIFVMSSYYEGSSIAVLEAGSCGLPLLIYDSPGLKESVIDGFNGLLVKQNYQDLANGLKKLIINEELRITFGMNARKNVQENYNMIESANKLLDIYFK